MMNLMPFRKFSTAALAAFALALPAISRAQTTYSITDLGPTGSAYSIGFAINASGQIAGYSDMTFNSRDHAFRYDSGGMSELTAYQQISSDGYAINASGQVAGAVTTQYNPRSQAVVWTGGSITAYIGAGSGASYAYGINDSGQVTGTYSAASGGGTHAFRYDSAGLHDLGTLGGSDSYGSAINASGQIAGNASLAGDALIHAVRWTGAVPADLGTLGGKWSYGTAINASGQVAGSAYTANNAAQHAVRWTGTTPTDLGVAGGTKSVGNGINRFGVVVGQATTSAGPTIAIIAPGDTAVDLNTYLPAGSGWTLTLAQSINDRGWITGVGTINGAYHAYLLKPTNATVFSIISLEGVSDLSAVSPAAPLGLFHVSFRTPGTTTELLGADVPVTPLSGGKTGLLTIMDAPNGTYDVTIQGGKNLRILLRNQVISQIGYLPPVTLPAGDANNDNNVDATDFGAFVSAYNSDSGVPGSGYDPTCDFNFDGAVDATDFGLLVGNYGAAGAA